MQRGDPQPGVRTSGGIASSHRCRRIPGVGPDPTPGRVLQPDRLDHRHPDRHVPGRHAVDAVLSGAAPLRRRTRPRGSGRRVADADRRLVDATAARTPAAGCREQAPGEDRCVVRPHRDPRSESGTGTPTPQRTAEAEGQGEGQSGGAPALDRRDGREHRARAPPRGPVPFPPVTRDFRAARDERARAAARARPVDAGTAQPLYLPARIAARLPESDADFRRAAAHGPGSPARTEMPRVLGRGLGGPDPSRSGGYDVRVQARRRRQVQPGHRACRRPLPGDAGRVGAHRTHSRQVDRRHADSERGARSDLAAGAAAVGAVHPVGVQADAGARQDHPRGAGGRRPRHHAAPAHRRRHRHRQVGVPERDADQHPVPCDPRGGPSDPDRPEASGARDVRRHPAPVDAGGRRSAAGQQRAPLGGAGDGGALQAARRGGCAQHRPVQPQRAPGARRAGRAAAPKRAGRTREETRGLPRRFPTSFSPSTSWPT